MGYSTEEDHESFIEKRRRVQSISSVTPKESDEADADVARVEIVKKKEPARLHKCTYDGCNKTFRKPSRLLWHIWQHTGERPFKCDFEGCQKTYTTSSHLKRHTKTHDVIQQSIKCEFCKLTLKNRTNYRKHYQRVHNNKSRISCNECNVVFRKRCKLDEHMAMHKNMSSFKCDKCDKIFTTIYYMKKHSRAVHDRVLKCTEDNCNKEFFRFIDLRVHRATYHPKEFRCDECGKCYRYKGALRHHVHAHMFQLLSCPYDNCSKMYAFSRNLQHHINKKHLGVTYYCDACGMGLSEKASLIRHINVFHTCKKSRTKKRPKRGSERKRRKDAGLPRKSMVTKLAGLDLPLDEEKAILNRSTTIKITSDPFEQSDSKKY